MAMGFTLLKWGFFLLSLGVVGYLAWQRPKILPAVLAGAVALEISITWFPSLGPLSSQLGSLTRLVTVGIIGAALKLIWLRPEKRRELKNILTHYLTVALLIYLAVAAFSIVYSVDRSHSMVELLRLLTLFFLYLGCALLVEQETILWPLRVVHGMGVALVPLALYEMITNNFIWQKHLAEGGVARVNGTFVDPNIFARYFVLGIIANLIFQYLYRETTWQRIVYLVTLLGLLGGLAITLSRGGMLTLVVILVLMVLLVPRKQMVWPIGVLGLGGGAVLAASPAVWQRLLTLKAGFGALDPHRQYLWKVAGAMFADHPLGGVGLGGFQKMFLTQYISMKTEVPDMEGATLSHTTALTIASELGVIGLAALAWVWLSLLRVLRSLRRLEYDHYYLPGVGYFLWVVAVFVSSQLEGRFFEDPIIWLSMSVMLYLLGDTRVQSYGVFTSRNRYRL